MHFHSVKNVFLKELKRKTGSRVVESPSTHLQCRSRKEVDVSGTCVATHVLVEMMCISSEQRL